MPQLLQQRSLKATKVVGIDHDQDNEGALIIEESMDPQELRQLLVLTLQ